MILITIIIILALQQWLLAGTEGEHDIAHIASSIILASLCAGFFFVRYIASPDAYLAFYFFVNN
ncbi:hypothetical protein CTN06_04070 [Pectobacterium zantedeschiae]|nr:hypothetical protein CTN06_04070 [Pectobacterium zantedeschiae]